MPAADRQKDQWQAFYLCAVSIFISSANIWINIDQYGSISIYMELCGVLKVDGVANRVRFKMQNSVSDYQFPHLLP